MIDWRHVWRRKPTPAEVTTNLQPGVIGHLRCWPILDVAQRCVVRTVISNEPEKLKLNVALSGQPNQGHESKRR
jgi:hypothetical protein